MPFELQQNYNYSKSQMYILNEWTINITASLFGVNMYDTKETGMPAVSLMAYTHES
jgi:hypothetical protein